MDVQEDGVYADWFVSLNFRNSSRDLFRLRVPKGMRVESVKGGNIRSWEVVNGAAGNQDISVEMLEAAQDMAQLRVSLVRYRALPADEIDQFEVPVVSVPDAVSQKGAILVRRSPMLDITIDEVQRLSRLDVDEFPGLNRLNSEPTNTNNVQVISRENPLGIRPLFAYQFTHGSYALTLGATETKSRSSANLKSLIRVSPQEITLESMIHISDGSRPIHQVELVVPKDLVIRRLSAPGLVEWAEDRYESVNGEAKLVSVLLGQGLKKALTSFWKVNWIANWKIGRPQFHIWLSVACNHRMVKPCCHRIRPLILNCLIFGKVNPLPWPLCLAGLDQISVFWQGRLLNFPVQTTRQNFS